MRFISLCGAVGVVACLLPSSRCEASTLPPVDFQARQVKAAIGIFDASVDYAVLDRLSVGASFISELHQAPDVSKFFVARAWALRATYRLWEQPMGAQLGITLSGGETRNLLANLSANADTADSLYTPWVQPAFNVTLPTPISQLWCRATVGPVFGTPFITSDITLLLLQLLWPNVELAYRIAERHEITLGGNSLLGWRGTF